MGLLMDTYDFNFVYMEWMKLLYFIGLGWLAGRDIFGIRGKELIQKIHT
jgi:hypothetical protein